VTDPVQTAAAAAPALLFPGDAKARRKHLRKALLDCDITASAIADSCRVRPPLVSMVMSGQRRNAAVEAALAAVAGRDPAELWPPRPPRRRPAA
jgi:hypothetical protein